MTILVSDIAKIVGVSNATVSNALNNRKGVSEDKRQEILKVANELGYFKKTAGDTTRVELLIISDSKNIVNDSAFFSELISGVEKGCFSNNLDLVVRHINLKDLQNVLSIENLNDKTKGYILLATEVKESDILFLEKSSLPLVILDASFKNPNFTYISINNRDGGYNAAKYLINRGFSDLGIISSSQQIENFEEREVGFTDAIRDHLGQEQTKHIQTLSLEPTLEGSYITLKELLQDGISVKDAYFIVNDTIAFGVRKALDELGYKDKVSLVGFDDIPIAAMMEPALTTIKVEKKSLGKLAVSQMISMIEDESYVHVKILVNTSLIERSSVLK